MNWMGGARRRIKFVGERKLQKEFFDRKRLEPKVSIERNWIQTKSKLSQDLIALRSVNIAHSQAITDRNKAKPIKSVDLGKFHSCTRQINEVDLGPCSPTPVQSTILLNDGKVESSVQFSKTRYDLEEPVQADRLESARSIEKDSGYSYNEEGCSSKKVNHQKRDRKGQKRRPSTTDLSPTTVSNHFNLQECSPIAPFRKSSSYKCQKFDRSDKFFQSHYNHFVSEDFQLTPLVKYDPVQQKHRHSHRRKHRSKHISHHDDTCSRKSQNKLKYQNMPFQFCSTPIKVSNTDRKNMSVCVDSDHSSEIRLSPIKRFCSTANENSSFNKEPVKASVTGYTPLFERKQPHSQKINMTPASFGCDKNLFCKETMFPSIPCKKAVLDNVLETKHVTDKLATPCGEASAKHSITTYRESQDRTKPHQSTLSYVPLQCPKSDTLLDKPYLYSKDSVYHPKSERIVISSPLSAGRKKHKCLSEGDMESLKNSISETIRKPLCSEIESDFVYKPNKSFYRQATGRTPEIVHRSCKEADSEQQKSQVMETLDYSQNSLRARHPETEGEISENSHYSRNVQHSGQHGNLGVTDTIKDNPSDPEITSTAESSSSHVCFQTEMDDILKEVNKLEEEYTEFGGSVESHFVPNDVPYTENEEADMFMESEREMLSMLDNAEIVEKLSKHSPVSGTCFIQEPALNKHRHQHTQTEKTNEEHNDTAISTLRKETATVGVQCYIQPHQGRCPSLARLSCEALSKMRHYYKPFPPNISLLMPLPVPP